MIDQQFVPTPVEPPLEFELVDVTSADAAVSGARAAPALEQRIGCGNLLSVDARSG